MRVHDRAQIGTAPIDFSVEGKLRRRRMQTFAPAVRVHAHDVGGGQSAFVDARRRDPHRAVVITDREIATGGGGHALPVDSRHGGDELVTGMLPVGFHGKVPQMISR